MKTKMRFNQVEFLQNWGVWQSKGHQPVHKLKIFESKSNGQTLYSIGLLEYENLEDVIFPSESLFTNYEAAFAAIGRVLDEHQ